MYIEVVLKSAFLSLRHFGMHYKPKLQTSKMVEFRRRTTVFKARTEYAKI